MRSPAKYLFLPALILLLHSCSNDEKAFDEKKVLNSNKSLIASDTLGNTVRKDSDVSKEEGFAGIFEVPEMLALCVKDSAPEKDVAKKYAMAFTVLDRELKELGMRLDGAPGSIAYNNDPSNFVFECIYPIERIPAKQPKDCQVVVLEPSVMMVYNYYGPYEFLYKAYENIRLQLKKSKLEQVGPMREFYISDPTLIRDSTEWLTRIMVPVNKKPK